MDYRDSQGPSVSAAKGILLAKVAIGTVKNVLDGMQQPLVERRGQVGAERLRIKLTVALAKNSRDFLNGKALLLALAFRGPAYRRFLECCAELHATPAIITGLLEDHLPIQRGGVTISLEKGVLVFRDADGETLSLKLGGVSFLIPWMDLTRTLFGYDRFSQHVDATENADSIQSLRLAINDYCCAFNGLLTSDLFDPVEVARMGQLSAQFKEAHGSNWYAPEDVTDARVFDLWTGILAKRQENGLRKYTSCIQAVEAFLETWQHGSTLHAFDCAAQFDDGIMTSDEAGEQAESEGGLDPGQIAADFLATAMRGDVKLATDARFKLLSGLLTYPHASEHLHLSRFRAVLFGPVQTAFGRGRAPSRDDLSSQPGYLDLRASAEEAFCHLETSLWAVVGMLRKQNADEAALRLLLALRREPFKPQDLLDEQQIDELSGAEKVEAMRFVLRRLLNDLASKEPKGPLEADIKRADAAYKARSKKASYRPSHLEAALAVARSDLAGLATLRRRLLATCQPVEAADLQKDRDLFHGILSRAYGSTA